MYSLLSRSRSRFVGFSCVALVAFFLGSSVGFGVELSLMSGLYKSESNKNDGKNAGGSSTIQLGSRLGDTISGSKMHWFGEAGLISRSYTAAEGAKAPDGSTGIELGGGVQYFFESFSDKISPYLAGGVKLINDKDASALTSETETTGLLYRGLIGLKLKFDRAVFVMLETQLFESALFETEKTKTLATDTKTEKSKTELYVEGAGNLGATMVGVGFVF